MLGRDLGSGPVVELRASNSDPVNPVLHRKMAALLVKHRGRALLCHGSWPLMFSFSPCLEAINHKCFTRIYNLPDYPASSASTIFYSMVALRGDHPGVPTSKFTACDAGWPGQARPWSGGSDYGQSWVIRIICDDIRFT